MRRGSSREPRVRAWTGDIGARAANRASPSVEVRAGQLAMLLAFVAAFISFTFLLAVAPALALTNERAYEQVSAVHKGGVDAGPGAGPAALQFAYAKAAGNAFAYGSIGVFAGAQSGQPNTYIARRTATGWTSSAITPPAVQGGSEGRAAPLAVAEDLSLAAFNVNLGALQGPGLYVRRSDGTFVWETPRAIRKVAYSGSSDDARHIVFESADPLLRGVPTPEGGGSHVYEWFDGELRLVDRLPDGSIAPLGGRAGGGDLSSNHGTRHTVSADGSRIVFSSPAANQSSAGNPTHVYVRIDGERTVEASRSRCTRPDCNVPAQVSFQDAAVDGSRVLFATSQQLLNGDTDENVDLYSYDIADDSLSRLSAGAGGVVAVLASSADARVVYFAAGEDGVYVADRGALTQIASGPLFLSGGPSNCVMNAQTTPDGGVFAFVTGFDVTPPGGATGPPGLYRYDAASRELSFVAPSSGASLSNAALVLAEDCWRNHALSADGSRLVFTTPDRLIAADRNDESDVYEWGDGELALISAGTGGQVSSFITLSPDGRDLFFNTYDRLAPTDIDQAQDVYDARIAGGFPPPSAPSPPCSGADCHGAPSGIPAVTAPGSAAFSGAGNPAIDDDSCAELAQRAEKAKKRAKHARKKAKHARKKAKHARKKANRASGKKAKRLHKKAKKAKKKKQHTKKKAKKARKKKHQKKKKAKEAKERAKQCRPGVER